MPPGTRTRGGEYMGSYFEMMRYYHQYQEAAIKLDQKRRNLERLASSLKSASDPDEAKDLQKQIAIARAEYDTAKEEAENLWYLSNSGKPKPEVTADRETKWFTTFGIPAQPPKL